MNFALKEDTQNGSNESHQTSYELVLSVISEKGKCANTTDLYKIGQLSKTFSDQKKP